MITRRSFCAIAGVSAFAAPSRRTEITIRGEDFQINGQPTYSGRLWRGRKIEGLLMNSRMVQGVFDDLNPSTRSRWAYPDTSRWDADRNTREFVAAMAEWRQHGLLAFTINLQGGSPEGYSKDQPWENSAIAPSGELRSDYMNRLQKILDRADELGMVVILGCYYFGQDQRVKDERAVRRGVVNTAQWLLQRDYRNVLLEIANECDVSAYDYEILKPRRIPELIDLAKSQHRGGRRLLVGTSFGGGSTPTANVVRASDFVLLHGNGRDDPTRITNMVEATRALDSYRPMPVVINEDDHFRFDEPANHMLAALDHHVSWGYFDPGKSDYREGYQCPPVNWGINTQRKKAFFDLLKEVTGV